jgi:hypothetical protein
MQVRPALGAFFEVSRELASTVQVMLLSVLILYKIRDQSVLRRILWLVGGIELPGVSASQADSAGGVYSDLTEN